MSKKQVLAVGKSPEKKEEFDVHGKKQLRRRNDPPVEEVGKRHQHPRSLIEQAKEGKQRQEARYDAAHGRGMVRALRVLRHPEHGEHGLDDLLHDDGAENLGARHAVARGDLCRVVDAPADEPGRAGAVEEVEEGRDEPVGRHGREDGEERVGEEGE